MSSSGLDYFDEDSRYSNDSLYGKLKNEKFSVHKYIFD